MSFVEAEGAYHGLTEPEMAGSTQPHPHDEAISILTTSEAAYGARGSVNRVAVERGRLAARQKLIQASTICAVFMIIEVVAGVFANSLALITDASHLLSDLSSFLIGLFALWVSDLPGTGRLSFGYHRAEILDAFMSVILIWALTGFLILEAFHRLAKPQPVKGSLMFATAFVGTLANIFMTYILGVHSHGIGAHSHHDGEDGDHRHSCGTHHHGSHEKAAEIDVSGVETGRGLSQVVADVGSRSRSSTALPDLTVNDDSPRTIEDPAGRLQGSPVHTGRDRRLSHEGRRKNEVTRKQSCTSDIIAPLVRQSHTSENLNLKAAYIHAVGDLIQNIGVCLASAIIWIKPDWSIVDPVCTFIFSILVLTTTVSIVKEALNVLMEGTPSEVDVPGLRDALACIPSVSEVHDLHVWSLSVGLPSLACHMVINNEEDARRVLRHATYICQREFGILHTTIQIDFSANKLACDTDAHSKCR